MEKLLALAISIASQAFEKKFDRAGSPYILHCIWVMNKVRHLGHGVMILAILHDLIEDTDWTIERLLALGFPRDICDDLELLTHNPEEPYNDYIHKMNIHRNVIEVKLRDLEHNSKITRLKGIRDNDVERMKKYHASYLYLKRELVTLNNLNL